MLDQRCILGDVVVEKIVEVLHFTSVVDANQLSEALHLYCVLNVVGIDELDLIEEVAEKRRSLRHCVLFCFASWTQICSVRRCTSKEKWDEVDSLAKASSADRRPNVTKFAPLWVSKLLISETCAPPLHVENRLLQTE